MVSELETDSPQIQDQVKDVEKRHEAAKKQVDGIVDDLESDFAEQSGYRDMLQV